MFWSIGNGKSISTWSDKWLLIPSTYCVQSPVNIFPSCSKVEDLIDRNSVDWKRQLIHQIFTSTEVEIIFTIPLSKFGADDKLIWNITKNGKFSICARLTAWKMKD